MDGMRQSLACKEIISEKAGCRRIAHHWNERLRVYVYSGIFTAFYFLARTARAVVLDTITMTLQTGQPTGILQKFFHVMPSIASSILNNMSDYSFTEECVFRA